MKATSDYAKDVDSYGSLFGIGLARVVGIGLLLLGIPLMLVWWIKAPAFFRRGRDPHPAPGARRDRRSRFRRILDAGPILDADLDAGRGVGTATATSRSVDTGRL